MKLVINRRELRTLEQVGKPSQKDWDSKSLRLVVFSDYRVQDISLLLDFVRSLQPAPQLLLYAGDDVERFQEGPRNFFEELAATATHGLCAVIGNDSATQHEDSGERVRMFEEVMATRAFIKGANVHNVHSEPVIIGDYAVIGIEGSPLDETLGAVGTVSYPEVFISRHLRIAAQAVRRKRLIIVSHTPPRGVLDSAIRFGRRQIGSKALRQFLIKRRDVPLVVCGHVHSCGAKSQRLGHSTVVNAASHDDPGAPGRVAVIELQSGKVRSMEWHRLWELSSVPGIGQGRESRLREAGIHDLRQLAEASGHYVAKSIKGSVAEGLSLRARASSLLKQEVVQLSPIRLPAGERAYLDVETNTANSLIWLIGIHVEREGKTYSFYADTAKREEQILADMLNFLKARPRLNLLSYSGCRMEQRMLSQRLAAYRLPVDVANSVRDIYFDIHDCVAFPTQGLTLKDVAKYCGFVWRDSDMDGFGAALLYGSGKLTKTKKRALIRYNEDDLLALKCVLHHLEKFVERTQPSTPMQATLL
jgi:uncharacterized protein YprB with RNaseH-like and TPR domain